MKSLLAIFAILALACTALAQSTTGDLTAVNAKEGTLTVSRAGGDSRVYRTRPSVEVFINGVRGKFAELAAGMTVRLTSGEPGLATRLDASGTPQAATGTAGATPAAGDLEHRLIGTTWVWWETKTELQTITFAPDGKAWWSLKQRGDFTWKVVPGENRIEGISPYQGAKYKITFDASVAKGKIYEGNDHPRETHLLPK